MNAFKFFLTAFLREFYARLQGEMEEKLPAALALEGSEVSKDDINWVIKMNARKDELAKALKLYEAADLEKRIAHLCEPDPPKVPPKKGSPKLAPSSPSTH